MEGCKKLKETTYSYLVDYYVKELKEKTTNRNGKLFVIEGVDGSGKETQSKLLEEVFIKSGYRVKRLSFPNYDSPSSGPVKQYLDGKLGGISDLDPYAISTLYASDRYCTIQEANIEKLLKDGYIVICDRYAESNFIHQISKIVCSEDKTRMLIDLIDLEYFKMKIPVPDIVFYLSIPFDMNMQMLDNAGKEPDLHEANKQYLKISHQTGLEMAELFNWEILNCVNDNSVLYAKDIMCKKIVANIRQRNLLKNVPRE